MSLVVCDRCKSEIPAKNMNGKWCFIKASTSRTTSESFAFCNKCWPFIRHYMTLTSPRADSPAALEFVNNQSPNKKD